MGGIPLPPEVDLLKVAAVEENFVLLTGINSHDGTPVQLVRHGDPGYFKQGEKFKVTFDPVVEPLPPAQ
jgi:hypothetical protein